MKNTMIELSLNWKQFRAVQAYLGSMEKPACVFVWAGPAYHDGIMIMNFRVCTTQDPHEIRQALERVSGRYEVH